MERAKLRNSAAPRSRMVLLFLLTSLPPHVVIGQQPVKIDFPAPLELSSRAGAVLLPFGDTRALVYELLIANPTATALAIEHLDALDGDARLASWDGGAVASLARRLPPPPSADQGAAAPTRLILEPGERYILYLWIDSMSAAPVREITHRARVTIEGEPGAGAWTFVGGKTPVRSPVVRVDAPVRGGRWLVGNGFANDTDHRRFFTVSGELFIPQRFGADLMKLGDDGNNATAERPIRNEIFHAYDEPVYAVADGEVVRVRSGLADRDVGSRSESMAWDEVPGNHVVLQLADGVFALYAHLRQGSLAVRAGDRVRRGALIGRIGNSGNSSSPHLHFHMMDGLDPNLSEGVPFTFNAFEKLIEDYRFRPEQIPLPSHGPRLSGSAPRLRWVIQFPDGK